ncbi:transporter substrate-binding domain-containing protein [uncultured Arthrobacter sp.]|uniref:transporter substrate-binding domain-containing protein n=1 Tax=uncultured Arthrobacter sp. TaxID=114050 RepID=UPI0026108510|nr:transporter substrate-binding domain-containing protein [uncultured Arthrobacter sp.]
MKKLATTCTVAVLALILSGCGGSEESSSSSSSAGPEGLVNEGKLTACIDPEYAPLEYYENGSDGEIVGFDADGIRALAEHWGVEANMNVTSFDGLMPQLQSGSCDMIYGGLYMSEERLAIADASPVMNAGPTILTTPDEAAGLTEAADLCGLTVAAQAASANAISINEVSETCVSDGMDAIKVDEYPKTAETVLAVLNGKADALVETNVAAAYMVTQNEGKLAEAGDIFELDTTFGVFSRKDDPISPAIAEGLKALQADGTMAEIAEKYNLDPSITDVD